MWNPWHGCTKYSEGCAHCYVYRRDGMYDKDASQVHRTADFDLPLRKKRDGSWKLPAGEIYACMTSDFYLDAADPWRDEAWRMIRQRPDITFNIITKRILRAETCLPADWGDGYPNVRIGCTMENQRRADERLQTFLDFPARRKFIICEPLLTDIDFHGLLDSRIESITAGGESGDGARICKFDWVLHIRRQCIDAGIGFHFKQTGANFVKDGKRYRLERRLQSPQARRARIDYDPKEDFP